MTPNEELARYKRALPIVWALIASGIGSQMAAMGDPGTEEEDGRDSPDWKLAAQLAGHRDDYVPSTETQKLVIRLLVDHEKAVERLKSAAAERWAQCGKT